MNIVNLYEKALQSLHDQRDRWILWTPVPLAMGIAIYFYLASEPPIQMGLFLFAVASIIFLFVRKNKMAVYFWLPFFLVALGFLAGQVRTYFIDIKVLTRETYPVTIEGRVEEVDALPKAYRVILEETRVTEGWPPKGGIPARVRIKLKNKETTIPRAGDKISVRAVLLPLSPPVLPGAFDFQRHAFYLGIGATGYAIGDVSIIDVHPKGDFFENLRHAIQKKITQGMQDKAIAAVVTAFLIGESKAIPEETWDYIRESGIAHLMAISGFHVTVMTGFFFFSLRALLAAIPPIALRYNIKKISAFFSIFAAVFYLQLIGSPIPAERAVIMAAVVMLAIMIDRDPFSLRLAAFAAIIVLLSKPESLSGPSFQMSFSAVIALIALYESAKGWLFTTDREASLFRKFGIYLFACLATTVIATIATGPYTLFHFSRVPVLSGLFANMIAVPVSSFITLPFGAIACLLMPFGLEGPFLWVVEKSMYVILEVARETASWKHAVFILDSWPGYLLGIMTTGGLWICIWRGKMRWLGIIPIVCAAWVAGQTARPDILISQDGAIFAVRDDKGKLWLSSDRKEKFIAEEWIAREGSRGHGYWSDPAAEDILRCDDEACHFNKKGKTISFIKKQQALVRDCTVADIFISSGPLPWKLCWKKKDFIIDKGQLRRWGAHTVYIQDDGSVLVESVNRVRGDRPWMGR